MAEEVPDPTALIERYKEQVREEVTAGYAKELFGTIIGFSLSGSRRGLMEKYEKEASTAYKTGNFDIALDRFCHYLAIVEVDPSTTVVSEMRATLTSNIGACLHQLGSVSSAQDYYERALTEFKALPFSIWSRINLTWIFYGSLIDKRVSYIEARLETIRKGEMPDPSTYQDGFGKLRKWSQSEMEGKDSGWGPTRLLNRGKEMLGYGKLDEVQVTPNAVATAA